MYRYSLSFLVLVLLTSCSAYDNQTLEGQPISENPLLPLSTTNENADPTEDEPVPPEVINLDEDTSSPPGFAVPQETPGKQNDIEPPSISGDFQVPLKNFKERWNALSSEQASKLQIGSLDKTSEGYFHSLLPDGLELMVVPAIDRVEKILLYSKASSNNEISSMLAGWSQLVYLFEPEGNPHLIDELFTELGVGPNLDISDVQDRIVERSGIRCTLKRLEDGLQFEASHQEN